MAPTTCRRLRATWSAIVTAGTLAGVAAQAAPTVLTVDASRPFKPVDHAASGSLYGIGDEGWPPDEWIARIRPKMFTQPPPGATHRPNQEPAPVGDTLKVWRVASRAGASLTIRLPDIFPSFPYQWRGDDYWYAQVKAIVNETLASGANNVYGYEIWNEPQWTWKSEWGDYFAMWERTYRLIRELDPHSRIIGPSYDRDYETGLRRFMTLAVGSGTVPDIVSWHELSPSEGLRVGEHVAFYRSLETELGIPPRPISINEYGSPRDAGVPGWLVRFVARLERAKVDTANLAFWHKPGRLSDLLVPVGGGSGPARRADPTGNYWLFAWYGDMTGDMVETKGPDGGRVLDGFASADKRTRTVRVIFGGGGGDIRLEIEGLRALRGFGDSANVQVLATEWTGTDGASAGPVPLFEGKYPVRDGSISIPVSGLQDTDAYLAVIRPAKAAPRFNGPVRRHEAEDATVGPTRRRLAASPLASNNRYVSPRDGGGELSFTTFARVAGAYDIAIRYTNPSGAPATGTVAVNDGKQVAHYAPTTPEAPFATHRMHIVLRKGRNEIRLRIDTSAMGLDYIEVTPFRARFEAETGEWTDATLVRQDMAESNFFAARFSGDAYVRDLSKATSQLRLPVTVPAAGTYRLKIGYSTAGEEAERRAQIPARHLLRVDDGEWRQVVYPPTQFREMIRQTTVVVNLPAGTSTITLAKGRPDIPGETQPGIVDVDYIDVELESGP